MITVKMSLEEFTRHVDILRREYCVAAARARRPEEEKSFDAYVVFLGWWRGEKRLLILALVDDKLLVAVAPPVPHPFCVSRGADEEREARAIDEVLYELGSRYTSWCRVYYPPGFRPTGPHEAMEYVVELEVLDYVEKCGQR